MSRAAAVLLTLVPLLAAGHDGHRHADEAAPAVPAALPLASGSRVALRAAPIELVLVRDADGSLVIHADDDASNAPLEAELSVQLGRRRVQAAALTPGSWRLPAAIVEVPDGSPLRCEFRRAGQRHDVLLPLPPRPER